jgi:hypothetical protein
MSPIIKRHKIYRNGNKSMDYDDIKEFKPFGLRNTMDVEGDEERAWLLGY